MDEEDDPWKLGEKAVKFDNVGKAEAAIYYYGSAAECILHKIKDGALDPSLRIRAEQYVTRAEELHKRNYTRNLEGTGKSKQQLDVEKADFLLHQALDEDVEGNTEEAIELYTESVTLCLATRKATNDPDLQHKLKILAEQALERAESLKGGNSEPTEKTSAANTSLAPPPMDTLSLHEGSSSGSVSPNTRRKLAGTGEFTKEELQVLRRTSVINEREYVPFMTVDLKERFAFPVPFTDRDGALALSSKQKKKFKRWVRPDDFLDKPTVIDRVDSGTIKQTIVSDCSFVASLAIAARYERKTGKKLVTGLIFPQNRKGDPVYNPCGKYMVKFNLNGIGRKIIIDDYLPMGHHGDLLCSYSQNRNELWVSLLEKAYLKVMGGYDFPGSNSNIDLHALTGWIPERIAIRPGTAEFNKDETFEKIFERYHKGDCLVTLATGPLSQADQDRAGLVECHAYAMLDIRKVDGLRLFLVKNPWNHMRWKGKYSDRDTGSWSPRLQKALSYNPNDAQQFDDGVFWIDYDSVCHFFDVFYLNWNPSLFLYTYCIHSSWSAGVGPVKDLYSIGDNPQYSLRVNTSNSAAVWVLLTRHITDKQDFAENKEYITILVYKSDGKKIYYPFDPPPYIDGTRINSPHYLCKMVLPNPGTHNFTLVVAQYEKYNTINYTLRVYSTTSFSLQKITDDFGFQKKETGEWKGKTAGGCGNNRDTYKNNPIYQLSLNTSSDDNSLLLDLRAPKQYSVGFDLVQVSSKNNRTFTRQSSGSYRPGYCVLRADNVPAGGYNIIPTTFLPNQEGPFFLNISSSVPITISRIQ